jgi:hypothetical protein
MGRLVYKPLENMALRNVLDKEFSGLFFQSISYYGFQKKNTEALLVRFGHGLERAVTSARPLSSHICILACCVDDVNAIPDAVSVLDLPATVLV